MMREVHRWILLVLVLLCDVQHACFRNYSTLLLQASFFVLQLQVVQCDIVQWDCPMRQLGMDFAARLQPFRSVVSCDCVCRK